MSVSATVLVLDTNVVLDLFVYEDPETQPLSEALAGGVTWIVTAAMREELVRVLDYPQIARRLVAREVGADGVLALFDAQTRTVSEAAKAQYTCKDPDDQKFIDLAVAHQAVLLSKDAAVLCMGKRLARLGVAVSRRWPPGGQAT